MAAMSDAATGMARIGQQRAVQRALDRAGFRRRDQFRPRQIDLEEIVGDDQPAAVVAVEQMMAAGEPEVAHLLSRAPPADSRSTASAGSSSPSTSHEGEGARRLRAFARAQRAELLAHRAVFEGAVHGDQRVLRLRAQRFGEGDLFFRRCARRRQIGRAEVLDQLLRQRFDQRGALAGVGLDDLHQRRPPERFDAEEAAAERRARLAFDQSVGIAVPEREGARHRPLARLGRALEHESVRVSSLMVRNSFMRGLGASEDQAMTAQRAPARVVCARPCR